MIGWLVTQYGPSLMKWSRITGRLRTLTRTGDKNPINQHHKVTWEHYGGIFKGYESNNPLLRHVNSTPHPRFTTRPGQDHISGVRVGKPSTVSLLVIRLCSNWSHYKDNRYPKTGKKILNDEGVSYRRNGEVHSVHENEFWARALIFLSGSR